MTYKIAEKAKEQIQHIYDYYLVYESPQSAIKVLDSFYETFKAVASNPYIFPSTPNTFIIPNVVSTRKGIIHRTFVFIYDVYESHLEILDVYHGKRDI